MFVGGGAARGIKEGVGRRKGNRELIWVRKGCLMFWNGVRGGAKEENEEGELGIISVL